MPAWKKNTPSDQRVQTAHRRDKSFFQPVVAMYPTVYEQRRLESLRRGVKYSAWPAKGPAFCKPTRRSNFRSTYKLTVLFLGGEELLRSWAGYHARNLQRGRGRDDARATLGGGLERTFVPALRGRGLKSPDRQRGGLML